MTALTRIAPCNGNERRIRVQEGVTEPIADRLAVAYGHHPHTIWPDMLDHAIADAAHPDAELWAQDPQERRRLNLYVRDQRRLHHGTPPPRPWAPQTLDSHAS